MRPKQAIDSPIQSTLADMMEWAIAEIDATSGKQVEVVGNSSWPISTKTLPVIASVAKQSISPRDGPPTSSQNRWCSERFKDPLRRRTRRGPIGRRAAAEPWIASLRS
jgi:hypothetical protein